MIPEEGNRKDFKRCMLESVEHHKYGCGHVYIRVHGETVMDTDFLPVFCPWCDERKSFMAQRGETTFTLNVILPKPCECINISFVVP
jgi:hypothetical protein